MNIIYRTVKTALVDAVAMHEFLPQVLQIGETASPEHYSCQMLCHVVLQVHHVRVPQEAHVLEQATLVPLCKMLAVRREGQAHRGLTRQWS